MTDIPMPVEIDDVTMAFPATALEFMPHYDDIPLEFREGYDNKWVRFQTDWFHRGLSDIYFETRIIDGEQLDPHMVWRQLVAIQGSFAPKHEHKVAAVAYLAAIWIESLYYKPRGGEAVALGAASMETWIEFFEAKGQEEEEAKA